MTPSDQVPAIDAPTEAGVLDTLVAVGQFEPVAQAAVPESAWNYAAGGSGDERTLARNHEAWGELRLAPHTLVDVSSLDTSTEIFGLTLPYPVLVAPTASHRLYHPDGERATIRGAAAAEAVYVQSSLGSTALADVAEAAAGADEPWLFQLYIQRDRGFTRDLVAEAVASGARALVLTVDTPCLGARDRDKRNQFGRIDGTSFPILASMPIPADDLPAHRRVYNPLLAPDITWDDLSWLVGLSPVPVITKGHLRADDAARAVDAGVAGIIVSNHGARNLDTVPATAEALPGVVDLVAGRVPVLVDGGIRRGTDIVKALSLGAAAVLVGRPVIWGLAVAGAPGVTHVLEILRTELEMAMALLGATSLADLTPDLIWPERR